MYKVALQPKSGPGVEAVSPAKWGEGNTAFRAEIRDGIVSQTEKRDSTLSWAKKRGSAVSWIVQNYLLESKNKPMRLRLWASSSRNKMSGEITVIKAGWKFAEKLFYRSKSEDLSAGEWLWEETVGQIGKRKSVEGIVGKEENRLAKSVVLYEAHEQCEVEV